MAPRHFIWLLLALAASGGTVLAGDRHNDGHPGRHHHRAATGIGLRGSYWDVRGSDGAWIYAGPEASRTVDISGFGGQLYLFSRIEDQLYAEFMIGAVGSVESRSITWRDDEVQVAAVMPTLLGIKYDLVRPDFDSALRPYLGAGGGIYWASDIQVIERDYYDEEVGVDSEARPGAYAGGGIDFLIGEHFLINYDVKYHWVDFDSERFDDGWEFALGFAITWGR